MLRVCDIVQDKKTLSARFRFTFIASNLMSKGTIKNMVKFSRVITKSREQLLLS